MIRWIAMAVIFGLLAAGVLYDRVEQDPNIDEVSAVVGVNTPTLDSPPPISDTWFCVVGSSSPDGYATSTVIITNLGDSSAVANLDLQTDTGPGASLRLDLEPGETQQIDVASLGSHAAAGAVVEVIGGEGVVSHRVTTAFGTTEGPCGSASSSTWYLAAGSTTRDTTQYLAILNPFPNDVVFTATFQTANRTREPSDLTRAVVPAHSVRVIDVGAFVARERVVAATIQTGDGSQLVVERLQTFDGSLGPLGAAMELAVPTAATEWRLPAGRIHEGGDNTLTVFNPGVLPAEVDLQFDPLVADDREDYGLVPIELTVQPGRLITVDLALQASQIGLPLPYELGITVTSANLVPVVVDRWQLTPPIDVALIGAGEPAGRRSPFAPRIPMQEGGDEPESEVPIDDQPVYAQATPRIGSATSRGTNVLSTRWVSAFTSLFPDNGTVVVVSAPEGALVEVRQMLGGTLGSPVRASVDESGRAVIPLANPVDGAPLIITSDRPIAAEIQIVTDDRFDVVALVPTVVVQP